MPSFKSRVRDAEGVVHTVHYETMGLGWLTLCGLTEKRWNDETYTSPLTEDTSDATTCLSCLGREGEALPYGWRDDD